MSDRPNGQINSKKGFVENLSLSFQGLIKGTLFANFVRKNSTFILFLFILIIAYITNKYGAERDITRINQLKSTITDLRYELQTINASLVEKNRQSVLYEKLQQKGIDLAPSKTPPTELKK